MSKFQFGRKTFWGASVILGGAIFFTGFLFGERVAGNSQYKDIVLNNMYELKIYSAMQTYLQNGQIDQAKYTINKLIFGQIAILTDKEAQKFLGDEEKNMIHNLQSSTDRQEARSKPVSEE